MVPGPPEGERKVGCTRLIPVFVNWGSTSVRVLDIDKNMAVRPRGSMGRGDRIPVDRDVGPCLETLVQRCHFSYCFRISFLLFSGFNFNSEDKGLL